MGETNWVEELTKPMDWRQALTAPGAGVEAEIARSQNQPALQGSLMAAPPQSLHERLLSMAANFSKRAVLPTVGSVGGQLVGERYLGEPGRQLGGAAGSVAGTAVNMALGIEAPSLENLLVAAGTPAAARGATTGVARILPGSSVARLEEITQYVKSMPDILRAGMTPTQVDDLFAAARTANPGIQLTNTGALAGQVVAREAKLAPVPGLRFSQIGSVANDLQELARIAQGRVEKELVLSPLVDQFGNALFTEQVIRVIPDKTGKIPLDTLDLMRQRIGALIGTTTDTAQKGELRAFYKGIMQDIETSAATGTPGAAQLMEGIRAQRRLFAAEDWEEEVQKAIGRPRSGDNLQSINTGALLREVQKIQEGQPSKRFELFAGSIAPNELQSMREVLERMNRQNTKLLAPIGVPFGSGLAVTRGGGVGAIAYGGSRLLGAPISGEAAFAIGAGYNFGSYLISRLLLTPLGRSLLHHAMDTGTVINPVQLASEFLVQGARGGVESLRPPAVTPTPEQRLSAPVQ